MNPNKIPEKLNDFKAYIDNNNYSPGITDIELPSINSITDTESGAGILGEYDSPLMGQFESMKIKLNWKSIGEERNLLFVPGSHKIDCRLANQYYDVASSTHKISVDRVIVQGPVVSNELGKVEKGSKYEGSTEIEVIYLKIESNGKVLLELDKLNYIFKVNGKDQLATLRKALGM